MAQNYLFEGAADGVTATTATTGASLVATNGNGTVKHSSAMGAPGVGLAFSGASSQALVRLPSDAAGLVQAFSGILTTPDVNQASGDQNLQNFEDNTTAVVSRLQWKQTGVLQFTDKSAAHTLVVAAAGVLSNATKYRVEVLYSAGTGTADTVTVKVYTPAAATGSTPVAQVTASNLNLGTNPLLNSDLGMGGGIATQQTFGWDTIQMQSGRTTEFGPYTAAANVPPSVSASSAQSTTTPGQTVTLTGTATDSDGTIASRAWSFTSVPAGVTAPTISNASSATATFVPPSAGLYVAQFAATDNSGATSTATVSIYVGGTAATVIGQTANPGGWTSTPSGSGIPSVLSDASTSTYAESPASPSTAATVRLRLAPLQPLTSFSMTLGSASLNGTGNLAVSATLYEGSTARKTWTGLTPTGGDIALTMTAAECATIGSWNALDVELSATAA